MFQKLSKKTTRCVELISADALRKIHEWLVESPILLEAKYTPVS